jgi:hypothetical protein
MAERKLRIVKHDPPIIGICERCNAQFKSANFTPDAAKHEISAAFNTHKCKPVDSSQNALRIVREVTEGK